MEKLRKLIREIVEDEIETAAYRQPMRSPFSHSSYYNGGGRPFESTFQDVTQLYNMTYRANKNKPGAFESVMYSEPINILVAFPTEESEFDTPFAMFGLKVARGYGKDYRFINKALPGAGGHKISEEQADLLLNDTRQAIREINPKYIGLLGDVELSDESLNESFNIEEKAVSKAQQRFFGMVYAYQKDELNLSDLDDDLADRIKKTADSISMSDAKEYAETDTEGLPQTVESNLREYVHNYVLDNVPPPSSGNCSCSSPNPQKIKESYGLNDKTANRLAWSIHHVKNVR